MNYELIRELHDRGFPQGRGKLVRYLHGFECSRESLHLADEELWVPTLEELIEACGSPYLKIEKPFPPLPRPNLWAAKAREETAKGWIEFKAIAATPTEAVARLWLALKPI